MTVTPNTNEARERARRTEYVRETALALRNNETLDQRTATRENRADDWSRWLRQKMDSAGTHDPSELLPDILAKLDQVIDDRVAAAVRDFKATLMKALK